MSTANRYILASNDSFYLVPSDAELYHHGVKGMKWGVRRTPQQLGHKIKKLADDNEYLRDLAKNYDAKSRYHESRSVRNRKHRAKYEAKLEKAAAGKAKYDLKLAKETNKWLPSDKKIGKYTLKSKKYENQMNMAKRKLKYDKDFMKSEDYKNRAKEAREEIADNERLSSMYSKTLIALESGSVQQGRFFMQYILDEDE